MDCLFCSIIHKQVSAECIYEDDHVIAFLDVHPRVPGHTLVISKTHSETLLDLPDEEVEPLFSAVKHVAGMIRASLAPHGFTIGMNQGKASGQVVDHLHVHILPRFLDDNGGSIQSVVKNPSSESVQDIGKKIRGD